MKEKDKENSTHGGARKTAGRKPLPDELKKKYKKLAFSVPPEDYDVIKEAAKNEGKSMAKFIVEVLKKYIMRKE